MTAQEFIEKNYPNGCGDWMLDTALQEYAKIKCQELLGIVAEKARIINEDGDVYQQPHIFFCNGEAYKNWVDRDSILNAVDLENFCGGTPSS